MKKNKKVKLKLPIGYIGFNDEKTTKQKKLTTRRKVQHRGANMTLTVLLQC